MVCKYYFPCSRLHSVDRFFCRTYVFKFDVAPLVFLLLLFVLLVSYPNNPLARSMSGAPSLHPLSLQPDPPLQPDGPRSALQEHSLTAPCWGGWDYRGTKENAAQLGALLPFLSTYLNSAHPSRPKKTSTASMKPSMVIQAYVSSLLLHLISVLLQKRVHTPVCASLLTTCT